MHRHRLQDMQEWLPRPGRKPLILRGARQVGKSTLVRLFCEAATDRDLLTVNLERHPHPETGTSWTNCRRRSPLNA